MWISNLAVQNTMCFGIDMRKWERVKEKMGVGLRESTRNCKTISYGIWVTYGGGGGGCIHMLGMHHVPVSGPPFFELPFTRWPPFYMLLANPYTQPLPFLQFLYPMNPYFGWLVLLDHSNFPTSCYTIWHFSYLFWQLCSPFSFSFPVWQILHQMVPILWISTPMAPFCYIIIL